MTKKIRILLILTTLISFLISVALMLQIAGSFFWYQLDVSVSAEMYQAESYSPYAQLEPWEELEKEIKADYSDSNWSFRLVSGNLDTDVSIIICISIGTLFVCSTCGVYYIGYLYKKVSKKVRRA